MLKKIAQKSYDTRYSRPFWSIKAIEISMRIYADILLGDARKQPCEICTIIS